MSGMMQVAGGAEAEWRCPHCFSHNRPDHRMCTMCEKWRDLDWDCVMCGFKNFAKRDTCKSCGSGNIVKEAAATGGAEEGYAGQDWAGGLPGGGGLGGYQDPYSADPSFSQASPYQSAESLGQLGASQELPWMCGMCKCENAPQKILCFECSGHRERVEVRNRAAESRMMGSSSSILKQPLASSRGLSNPRHLSSVRGDITRVQYKPGGTVEDQSQDWNCGNCQNRNFAKRTQCNKCSKPRSEVEVKRDPMPLSSWDMRPEEQNFRTIPRSMSAPRNVVPSYQGSSASHLMGSARPEDRTQDWKCSSCQNRNFARRKECNKCKKPREEVEDKEVKYENEDIRDPRMVPLRKRPMEPLINHSKQIRLDERPEDLSNDWVCGNCNINCFAKKTHCFRCNKAREEVENKYTSALQFDKAGPPSHAFSYPTSSRVGGHNLQLSARGFDRPIDRSKFPNEKPRKKWVDEDKSNDWNCMFCDINNFAKRKTCFRCDKKKEECEAVGGNDDAETRTEVNNDDVEQ